jgi:DNA modification methylase
MDIGNFYTTSKERIKGRDGKNIPWQKPLALIDRLILALTNKGDLVVDLMCGTGTTLESAIRNDRRYIGGDIDPKKVQITKRRLRKIK